MKPFKSTQISDRLIGTGEHMCTCAAIVADVIIEQGQGRVSFRETLAKIQGEGHLHTREDVPE